MFGEFIAILASMSFSTGSVLFTLAGRQFSPRQLLRISLPIALVCLGTIHWIANGQPFPFDAPAERWLYLMPSGIIGFWAASVLVFNAFNRIGPRLSLLIAATNPILAAILARIFLDQSLGILAVIGIAITISGIMFVLSEGTTIQQAESPEVYRQGILFAVIGSTFQAIGFVLSTKGLENDFDPLSAAMIRVSAGIGAVWIVTLLRGEVQDSIQSLFANRKATRYLVLGGLAGPFSGASLALVALKNAPVGIASTLLNLNPIFLIPLGYVVFSERITRRAVIGTMIAFFGTTLLFIA